MKLSYIDLYRTPDMTRAIKDNKIPIEYVHRSTT